MLIEFGVFLAVLAAGQDDLAEAETRLWNCPGGEQARLAIIDGSVQGWPNYSPGPGMRVQMQYPQTGLRAHAKFTQSEEFQGAICQYYNSVGLVVTMVAFVEGRAEPANGAYWREEWAETRPENDRPGAEMIETCVVERDGVVWPSRACPFLVPAAALE